MKNYVSTVLSKITNKTQRKQIEAELQSHIQDRIDYYVNAGYDPETATEKANAHMGDTAELVGDQLNAIKDAKFGRELVILFVFINTFALYIFGMFSFFGAGTGFATSLFGLEISSAYLLIALIELFVSIKIKRSFLAFCSSVLIGIHILLMFGYTPFVFVVYEIIAGRGRDISELFIHSFKMDNQFIYIVCVLFISLFLLLSIYVVFHISKFNYLKYGKNFYKNEKALNSIILVLFVIIASSTVFSYFSDSVFSNDFISEASYEGFYLIENDEMVNPETIENYDDKQIRYHYQILLDDEIETECISYEEQHNRDDEDFNKNYPIQIDSFDISYQKYDDLNKDVKYKTEKIIADFYTDKKYVMVVPMLEKYNENYELEYYPDFSKAEWINVSKEIVIKTKDREYRHNDSFLEYEITIIPK